MGKKIMVILACVAVMACGVAGCGGSKVASISKSETEGMRSVKMDCGLAFDVPSDWDIGSQEANKDGKDVIMTFYPRGKGEDGELTVSYTKNAVAGEYDEDVIDVWKKSAKNIKSMGGVMTCSKVFSDEQTDDGYLAHYLNEAGAGAVEHFNFATDTAHVEVLYSRKSARPDQMDHTDTAYAQVSQVEESIIAGMKQIQGQK